MLTNVKMPVTYFCWMLILTIVEHSMCDLLGQHGPLQASLTVYSPSQVGSQPGGGGLPGILSHALVFVIVPSPQVTEHVPSQLVHWPGS